MTDAQRAFIHRHVICFEETNVVGNVYFARHVAWQGACREMFLRTHAPGTLDEIERDLRLVTLDVRCTYFEELRAFDEVELRMTLAETRGNRISLAFDYRLLSPSGARQCARGTQDIGCMREIGGGDGQRGRLEPCPVPPELATALDAFRPMAGAL